MNTLKNIFIIFLFIFVFPLAVLSIFRISASPVIALSTGTLSPTSTPVSTLMITPTPTPLILNGENLRDEEISWLLFDYRYEFGHLPLEEWQTTATDRFEGLVRQQADVNGDGNLEILVSNELDSFEPYVAILGQVDKIWKVWLYTSASGHYCGQAKAIIESDKVVSDFLTCGGGTGIIGLTWEQRWIKCYADNCTVIWSAPLLKTDREVHIIASRGYSVAEILRPEDEIIQLITHRFRVNAVPVDETDSPLLDTTHRIVGPDTIEVFRWNGNIYQLENRTQNAPGLTIAGEFDLLTDETHFLVNDILVKPFQEISGSLETNGWQTTRLVNPEGYKNARARFWGLSDEDEIEWGTITDTPSVATHNGVLGELGEWIAGVIGSQNHFFCRLTVQRYNNDKFALLGRTDVPCSINFTHLAWVDVTGDGKEELLLRTIPPYEDTYKTGASLQRLYIYTIDNNTLTELATLDGEINGPDGEGIRWTDVDTDGVVEILAGLPLLDIENWLLPDNTARRFQIYDWDRVSQKFSTDEIWTMEE